MRWRQPRNAAPTCCIQCCCAQPRLPAAPKLRQNLLLAYALAGNLGLRPRDGWPRTVCSARPLRLRNDPNGYDGLPRTPHSSKRGRSDAAGDPLTDAGQRSVWHSPISTAQDVRGGRGAAHAESAKPLDSGARRPPAPWWHLPHEPIPEARPKPVLPKAFACPAPAATPAPARDPQASLFFSKSVVPANAAPHGSRRRRVWPPLRRSSMGARRSPCPGCKRQDRQHPSRPLGSHYNSMSPRARLDRASSASSRREGSRCRDHPRPS